MLSMMPGPSSTCSGGARARDGIADGESGGLLVTLDTRSVAGQLNNLADKLEVTNTNQLVHTSTGHVIRNHNCANIKRRRQRVSTSALTIETSE